MRDDGSITLNFGDGTEPVHTTGADLAKLAARFKNTDADKAVIQRTVNAAEAEIRSFVERFEALEVERKELADDQKEIMADAKGRGYDTKALRHIIKLRKLSSDDLAEAEAVIAIYREALGF